MLKKFNTACFRWNRCIYSQNLIFFLDIFIKMVQFEIIQYLILPKKSSSYSLPSDESYLLRFICWKQKRWMPKVKNMKVKIKKKGRKLDMDYLTLLSFSQECNNSCVNLPTPTTTTCKFTFEEWLTEWNFYFFTLNTKIFSTFFQIKPIHRGAAKSRNIFKS